jgi:hypothetical protein
MKLMKFRNGMKRIPREGNFMVTRVRQSYNDGDMLR